MEGGANCALGIGCGIGIPSGTPKCCIGTIPGPGAPYCGGKCTGTNPGPGAKSTPGRIGIGTGISIGICGGASGGPGGNGGALGRGLRGRAKSGSNESALAFFFNALPRLRSNTITPSPFD